MTRRAVLLLVVLASAWSAGEATGQTRRAPTRRPPARPATPARPAASATPAVVTEPAMAACPQVLGEGVRTKRTFCDVLIGRDPADGILITLPPHAGPVTLSFDLHNRHTYSEDLVKANRAYHRYTASIGVLTLDNTLISRGFIQSEFRTAADLVDRIGGGGGPGGLKAVAPVGTESVAFVLPAETQQVSILGEKLDVVRIDGLDNFSANGRPMALVSNLMVQYTPPPPARPARRR